MVVRLSLNVRLRLTSGRSGDDAAHWNSRHRHLARVVRDRLVVDGDDDAGDGDEEGADGADIHGPEILPLQVAEEIVHQTVQIVSVVLQSVTIMLVAHSHIHHRADEAQNACWY